MLCHLGRFQAAKHELSRRVAAWASAKSNVQPLTSEERETLAANTVALHAADRAALAQWGGFHAARRILIPLRQPADLEVVRVVCYSGNG